MYIEFKTNTNIAILNTAEARNMAVEEEEEVYVSFGRMEVVCLSIGNESFQKSQSQSILAAFMDKFNVHEAWNGCLFVRNGSGTSSDPFTIAATNSNASWSIENGFFNQPSSDDAIPEPLKSKHFIMKGGLCPDLKYVTRWLLEEPILDLYIVPKKFSLKNMNFAEYKGAINKDQASFKLYEEVQVTDDPYGNFRPLKSILLPRLSLNPNLVFQEGAKNKEISIMDYIRIFARSKNRGYLIVEGLIKTGKTMLCQLLIPMVLSHEENTKDFLYFYIDLKNLRDDKYSDFCSRLIWQIRDDLSTEAFGDADIRFRRTRDPPDLSDVLMIIADLVRYCKIVLVFDEVQYLNEHSTLHATEITNFLDRLNTLTNEGRLKLVFSGSEMIKFWYEITRALPNGTWLPLSALHIVLPSYHHPNLRNRIDEMLEESGYLKCKLTRREDQMIITTAAQMVAISMETNILRPVDIAFDLLMEKVIEEYNFSLAPFIRFMHEKQEYTPVLEELVSIINGPKIFDRLENILANRYIGFNGLFDLYQKVELEDGKWEVSLETSMFKYYIATLVANFDSFIKHGKLPAQLDFHVG